MLERVARSPSKTCLFWSVAFILGTAAHALRETAWTPWFGWGAAVAVFGAGLAWKLRAWRVRLLLAGLALFLAGLARYDAVIVAADRIPTDIPGAVADFVGTVSAEPRQGIQQTILQADAVSVYDKGSWRPVLGSVWLKIGVSDRVEAGDRIGWRCRPDQSALSAESSAGNFFLQGVVWSCRPVGGARIIAADHRISPLAILIGIRSRFRQLVGRLLPEPESSFLLGLLIGDRDGLPAKLSDDFRKSGTSHIVAVSGYNVSQVVQVCLLLLAVAAIRRKRAAALAVLAVAGFAVISGGAASVVRAGLMGGLALIAAIAGRRYQGTNGLAAAATAMLAGDPFLLRHDIGFQLSFAAVWGLHALGPALAEHTRFLPEFAGIRRTFGETAAATIFTMPLSLLHFGFLPVIGLLANLFVLPLIPWAMGTGAVAAALGTIHPVVGAVPAYAAWLILRIIEATVGVFALASPWSITMQIGALTVAVLYGWIAVLWYALVRAEPLNVFSRKIKLDGSSAAPLIIDVETHDRQP